MFGSAGVGKVRGNVRKALEKLDLKYQTSEDGDAVLSAMGDDNPIGMMIMCDEDNKTLNIYCYLMFDIPEDARNKLIPEINTVNNTINNGGFYMSDAEPKIYFKIVQSYFDSVPSAQTIAHLIMVAFKTVDVNDGKLKGLIPSSAVVKDPMFNRGPPMDRESAAGSRFACSPRERAVFEAGIKMGTIYHQFVGTPFSGDTVEGLERSIEEAVSVQPYVESVKVRIDRSALSGGSDRYSYCSLAGEMIDAVVTISLEGARVTAEMRYDPDLDYPLMFVSDIS